MKLPAPASPLIGRGDDVERAALALLRSDVRLLTLVGPPGVGKTRLALAVATRAADRFAGGTYFVDLAPLTEAIQVLPAITHALDLKAPGTPPRELLQASLWDLDLLLVLDNFEHVLDAAADLAEVLADTYRLKVLATSRVPLQISWEHRFPVAPLAFPAPEALNAPRDALVQYPAVALFADRALAINPGFALTDHTARTVAQICASMDGLPLAIELAAAHTRTQPLDAVLAEVRSHPTQLVGGLKDLPARQQTLHDAIGWSYRLLSGAEQAVFERLAVFSDGCTVEAAAAVCSAAQETRQDVRDVLGGLVERNLIQLRMGPGASRYTMLETIRAFALERLEASGGADVLRRAHLEYFLRCAEEAEPHLTSGQRREWLDRLGHDRENLIVALRWSLHDPTLGDLGLRLAVALGWFWYFRGLLTEGRTLIKLALSQPRAQDDAGTRAKALVVAGLLAYYQGDTSDASANLHEGAALSRRLSSIPVLAYALTFLGDATDSIEDAEEGVALFRQIGDRWGLALALFYASSVIVWHSDDPLRALPLLEEGGAIFKELGDDWGYSGVLFYLAQVARVRGDLRRARAHLEDALRLLRPTGDRWRIAYELTHLGAIAHAQGDTARAATMYDTAAAEMLALGDRDVGAGVLRRRGELAFDQGDARRAGQLFIESLEMYRQVDNLRGATLCLGRLGGLAAAAGRWEQAAIIFGAADGTRRQSPGWWWREQWARHDSDIDTARRRLGERAFARAWQIGQAMTFEQAIRKGLSEGAGAGPAALEVRLLGGFEVQTEGWAVPANAWRRRRDKLLFIYLLLARDAVPRDALLDALWPDLPPPSASASLHVAWSNLKRALEPGLPEGAASAYLVAEGGRYGLRRENIRTDVSDLEEAMARAQQASDPQEHASRLETAAALYRGELLPDEINEPWTTLERERLRGVYMSVLERLAAAQASGGHPDKAAGTLRALLRLEPWREETYRALMNILAGQGRRSEALRLYRECETILKEELGVAPSPETASLFEAIAASRIPPSPRR